MNSCSNANENNCFSILPFLCNNGVLVRNVERFFQLNIVIDILRIFVYQFSQNNSRFYFFSKKKNRIGNIPTTPFYPLSLLLFCTYPRCALLPTKISLFAFSNRSDQRFCAGCPRCAATLLLDHLTSDFRRVVGRSNAREKKIQKLTAHFF